MGHGITKETEEGSNVENYVKIWYNNYIKINLKEVCKMPLLLIIGGIVLRSIAPVLFYIVAIGFLAFLIYTAYAGIQDKEYGWKEGIASGIYAIIILVLMFT